MTHLPVVRIDPVAARIALRYPCAYAHAKYVLNLARELDPDNAEQITNDVISLEAAMNSGFACRFLERLVREKNESGRCDTESIRALIARVLEGGGK